MHEQVEEQKSEETVWKESVIGTKSKLWRKEVIFMLHMQIVILQRLGSRFLNNQVLPHLVNEGGVETYNVLNVNLSSCFSRGGLQFEASSSSPLETLPEALCRYFTVNIFVTMTAS